MSDERIEQLLEEANALKRQALAAQREAMTLQRAALSEQRQLIADTRANLDIARGVNERVAEPQQRATDTGAAATGDRGADRLR
jgi:hypothetical protein